MKTFLLPSALIVSVPAFVLIAFGAVPALGLVTTMGTLAMLLSDYPTKPADQSKLSPVRHQQSLPLAA